MITKEIIMSKFEIDQENKTISIRIDTIIKEDGVELSRNLHRTAFVPGDIDKVKAYLGVTTSPEIAYLEAMWTPAVIKEYKAKMAAQNNV